jgi:hypothetical protein
MAAELFSEASSINFHLDDFLGLLDNPKNNKIWLDVKNLTSNNVELFALALSSVIENFSLDKHDFLIESHNNRVLSNLNSLEFLTSFYLPHEFTNRKICPLEDELSDVAESIKEHTNTFISFPIKAKQLSMIVWFQEQVP